MMMSGLKSVWLAVVAVGVVLGVAVGGTSLWQQHFAPTKASAADCRLAQQLFDRAHDDAPSDPKKADAWERDIRQARYKRMHDEGLSTQVGRYVHWSVALATGGSDKPTKKQYDDVVDQARGHCRDSGVDLRIQPLAAP